MGVYTASATAEKGKWQILNPGPHRVEKFFPKYGDAQGSNLLRANDSRKRGAPKVQKPENFWLLQITFAIFIVNSQIKKSATAHGN